MRATPCTRSNNRRDSQPRAADTLALSSHDAYRGPRESRTDSFLSASHRTPPSITRNARDACPQVHLDAPTTRRIATHGHHEQATVNGLSPMLACHSAR